MRAAIADGEEHCTYKTWRYISCVEEAFPLLEQRKEEGLGGYSWNGYASQGN